LGELLGELDDLAVGTAPVGDVGAGHLSFGETVELLAHAVALGQSAGLVEAELDLPGRTELEAGAVAVGPRLGRPPPGDGRVRRVALLHVVGGSEEDEDPATVGLGARGPGDAITAVGIRARLLVLGLV